MSLTPTADQETALEMIGKGLSSNCGKPSVTVIAGLAGTGKTSLLNIVFERYGEGIVITPTGKAALRVFDATGIKAITAHKWLYRPMINNLTGGVYFDSRPPEAIAIPANGGIIFDEASMVGPDLFEDVYDMATKLGINIIAIGDNFQLPPIQKNPNEKPFNILDPSFRSDYSYQLKEIVRQAAGNPIIKASMEVRNGRAIDVLYSGAFKQVHQKNIIDTSIAIIQNGGAVICHKNATRQMLNNQIRERLGHSPNVLDPGEPLMVIHNNYVLGLFNGEITHFSEWEKTPGKPIQVLDKYTKKTAPLTYGRGSVVTSDGIRPCALTTEEVFGQIDSKITTLRTISFNSGEQFQSGLPYLHTNLGYALTCHKSQGSQWPEVLVVLEDSINLGRHEGQRWLYTAMTRAVETVQFCIYRG